MSLDIKINGINMFINKFDTSEEIIDIDKFKTSFELDNSDEGFIKLSLSQKKIFGSETINDTYNRPPIGPIEVGTYCGWCDAVGPEDHKENCDFPQKESLFLTLGGFKDYILSPSYTGNYEYLKDKINKREVKDEDLDEIMLLPEEIEIVDGTIEINEDNKKLLTKIPFDTQGVFKKRGPKKLAAKTTTTQFLNNIIISHEKYDHKTSIRISKNGLINLINIPSDEDKANELINELIKRIVKTDSVNKESINEIKGVNIYKKFDEDSFIHSMSAQFTLKPFLYGSKEVNFENLDNLISPFDRNGKLMASSLTSLVTTETGDKIIMYNGIKIIEWEYSLGRLTRNQIMSKEYIKFVTNVSPGLKMTCIINKYGTVTMTISKCSEKNIKNGLCTKGDTKIVKNLFDRTVEELNNLFTTQEELLVKKALDKISKDIKSYNTVSGNAVPSSVCRNTQTRVDNEGKNWKEGKRPEPYSWSGTCPDPNYQYISPEGVQGKDGLWYPCCKAKNEKSIETIRDYLIKGFPRNNEEGEKYNIYNGNDMGTGILIPDSNTPGSTANVKINGNYENVTVIKKKNKKTNEYSVITKDGKTLTVSGEDFERDSRVFPGLNTFNKQQLIDCVIKNIKRSGMLINEDGNLIKNYITEFNEKLNTNNTDIFKRLLKDKINKETLTYNNLYRFKTTKFNVKGVPYDSYPFYLCLGPGGNFYINDKLMSFDSDIINKFETDIIMFGYLRKNNNENINEYHIIDLIYFSESFVNVSFNQRYKTLIELQNSLLNSVTAELLVYPDFFTDVIEGSNFNLKQNEEKILVFTNDERCEYITWGEKDLSDDILELQILELTKGSIIKFGHSDNNFKEDLSFLNKYEFTKREIPVKLLRNDYITVKINRDFSGNIVPKRKLSIIGKTTKTKNYNEVLNKIYNKFRPINKEFFNDDEEWFISVSESLKHSNGLLLDA